MPPMNDRRISRGGDGHGVALCGRRASQHSVWKPGVEPGPEKRSGRARARALVRGEAETEPASVKELAISLPATAWTEVAWREGSNATLESRFAAPRVRPASSRD
jgi:SRSO17 transposase